MSDIKQASAMLAMARRDLKALGGMHDASVFEDEIFGFHVQQAVEKCLKAWMCAMGVTYPLTHQISRLLVLLRNAGADVDAYWWFDEFTIFAHQARYEEGHLAADAPLDRQKLIDAINSLVARISHQIELGVSMSTPQVCP
jgi:HEPN domain-containing protein